MIFDAPKYEGGYRARYSFLKNQIKEAEHLQVVSQTVCQGKEHLIQLLDGILQLGF